LITIAEIRTLSPAPAILTGFCNSDSKLDQTFLKASILAGYYRAVHAIKNDSVAHIGFVGPQRFPSADRVTGARQLGSPLVLLQEGMSPDRLLSFCLFSFSYGLPGA
jgi:hypothetical protein